MRSIPSNADISIDSLAPEITMDMKIFEILSEDSRWLIRGTGALPKPGRTVFLGHSTVNHKTAAPSALPSLGVNAIAKTLQGYRSSGHTT
jgi:hypothetical protein